MIVLTETPTNIAKITANISPELSKTAQKRSKSWVCNCPHYHKNICLIALLTYHDKEERHEFR